MTSTMKLQWYSPDTTRYLQNTPDSVKATSFAPFHEDTLSWKQITKVKINSSHKARADIGVLTVSSN